jgi:hypothetical protein
VRGAALMMRCVVTWTCDHCRRDFDIDPDSVEMEAVLALTDSQCPESPPSAWTCRSIQTLHRKDYAALSLRERSPRDTVSGLQLGKMDESVNSQ